MAQGHGKRAWSIRLPAAISPSTEVRHVQAMANDIAAEIRRRYRPRDPSLRKPGHARGIDTYTDDQLPKIITNILLIYRSKGTRFPNLLKPELYSEKLSALKLLAWLPVPESGNKLLTQRFRPPEMASMVKVPRILWQSPEPRLPPNGSLPDGEYYLKSNHGSGWCKRIRFPLAPETRAALEQEAAHWLTLSYNMGLGEWWYNVFRREIFIEECVTRRNPSAVMLFYVFRGRTGIISIDEKLMDGTNRTRVSLYDPSFNLLQNQPDSVGRVEGFDVSDELKSRARTVAEAIGKSHEALRVDLLPSESGELYLNEITVCSNSGFPLSRRDREVAMGEMWGPCSFIL